MKRIIGLFIAFGVLLNTIATGQINNAQFTKISPAQIQQMDLFQMEVMEIANMVIMESIKKENAKNTALESNDKFGNIEIQRVEFEIESSITSPYLGRQSSSENIWMASSQKADVVAKGVSLLNQKNKSTTISKNKNEKLAQSVIRTPNNFHWIKLNNQEWNTNENVPVPTTKFKVRNWKGNIQPGITSYY